MDELPLLETSGGRGPEVWGLKAAGLAWLSRLGVPVPVGFVVSVPRLARFDEVWLREAVAARVSQLGTTDGTWAVRSSPVRSLPGVLPTRLHVADVDGIADALGALREAARGHGVPCAAVIQRQLQSGPEGFAAAAFTRDPTRGTPGPLGEWAKAGVVGDVVGGRARLPALAVGAGSLARERPEDFEALRRLTTSLERAAGRVLELELLHDGITLWGLQARPVPRHPRAALRLASERLVEEPTAPLDLSVEDARRLTIERVREGIAPLGRGLAASPGIALGAPEPDPREAERRAARGEAIVLVRPHAVPDDVPALRAAAGILTSTGGLTCHAAVMARGLDKPAVVSCTELEFIAGEVYVGGQRLAPDTLLTLDGHTGQVYAGAAERVRLPAATEVGPVLRALHARRRGPLWLWASAATLAQGAAERLAPDAVLLDPGDGDTDLDLELWRCDATGTRAIQGPREVGVHRGSEPPPQGRALVWACVGGPPARAAPLAEGVILAVEAAHFLEWALVLDPFSAMPLDPLFG